MKEYKLAMILGRFQIFHKGHEQIINKALELAERVVILIGSADKANTIENPFDFYKRRSIIEEIYSNRVLIYPLNDLGVGNVPKWGDYVITECEKYVGIPDLVIYGDEDKCKEWYKNYPSISYYKVDRGIINISSTLLKQYLIDNEFLKFKEFVSPSVLSHYSEFRTTLMKIMFKKNKEELEYDFSLLEEMILDTE